VHGSTVTPFLSLPGAMAIEAGKRGSLYASADFTGPGSIIRIETRKKGRG
jgi:hypothetical protein